MKPSIDILQIKTINDLLHAIDTLPHVCKYAKVVADGVAVWKCECGKHLKQN
tara:strand:- start:4163 stop:4318 length:156 start_codon:yes stop_codon:yes gene_type:complete